ncbi:hypothetical protein SEVIR_3G047632v4 [Setaria viridis]|uniref:Uncharacterized protein n=1 Tax=Setaria viridis TaxID=4556 RepID=A0A4U6V8F2_SETVI|nr:hypothetical protein SEVIR_3G047632v2 [Setaria viridis]
MTTRRLGCRGDGAAVDKYVDLATLCSGFKRRAQIQAWGASPPDVLARCSGSGLWRASLRLSSKPWCDGAYLGLWRAATITGFLRQLLRWRNPGMESGSRGCRDPKGSFCCYSCF